MTPNQQPVMTLEETRVSLQQERDRAKAGIDRTLKVIEEGDGLAKGIGEMALRDWKEILSRTESALHHLESGKRDAERLDRLQAERWVDIRNKDEDRSEDGGRAAHTCIDLPGQSSAEGPTLREAIDALPPQPSQQEGQG